MRTLFISLILSTAFVGGAFAQTKPKLQDSAAELSGGVRPERGWFYFESNPKPDEDESKSEFKSQIPRELPPPPKEDKCKKKETWSVDCGFVNPGEDFAFQSKQRDALMERMSVAKNDLKAVEAFQYYMRYVIDRTAEVTNNWWYNMTQNPELDPTVSSPVSTFGIRLMTEVKQGQEREVFDLIKSEGGFLVYFTRSDCSFCHQMADTVKKLAKRTGLKVRNAALDDKCLAEFKEGCAVAPATLAPAESLQVTTVPTLFLYIPQKTWLRVATGVVDLESMSTRTSQFFAAYRAALVSGVENGKNGRPSVDFSGTEKTGTSVGVADAKPGGEVTPPTQAEVERLLGASTAK